MKINKSEFVKGVIGDDYRMNDALPAVSFLGRSNVGKSSVINSLTGRKKLAQSSKNPGKTQQANFFKINDTFYLIDFPGYGYAKKSINERNKMIKRIFWYLESFKPKPKIIFLIIDIKVGLTELDRDMIDLIIENNHNLLVLANKSDKASKELSENQINSIEKEIRNIKILKYSAKTNEGREEVLEIIEKTLSK